MGFLSKFVLRISVVVSLLMFSSFSFADCSRCAGMLGNAGDACWSSCYHQGSGSHTPESNNHKVKDEDLYYVAKEWESLGNYAYAAKVFNEGCIRKATEKRYAACYKTAVYLLHGEHFPRNMYDVEYFLDYSCSFSPEELKKFYCDKADLYTGVCERYAISEVCDILKTKYGITPLSIREHPPTIRDRVTIYDFLLQMWQMCRDVITYTAC